MKILLIVVVMTCCVFAGLVIKKFFYTRQHFFADLCSFCDSLKLMISHSNQKILSIAQQTKDRYKKEFGLFLDGYIKYLNGLITIDELSNLDCIRFLSLGEKRSIINFFSSLGSMPHDEEIEKIVLSKNEFDSCKEMAKAQTNKLASMQLKLFILVGLMFVVIFI